MNYLLYLFSIILIQQTSAQIFTVAGKNLIPNFGSNIPIATNIGLGNGIAVSNFGQTPSNIANANLENYYIPTGKTNQGFVNGNTLVANIANANANIGVANNDPTRNYANIGLANNANVGLAKNANIGLANNAKIGSGNNANIGLSNNANVAKIGVSSNVNVENTNTNAPCSSANVATSNYANIVKPPRDFGIEFDGDALEVNGAVQVSGRMPFNANIAVQGSVPAQGQGTVSYKCDKPSPNDS